MNPSGTGSTERLRIISAMILSISGLLLAGALVVFLILNGGQIIKLTTDVVAIVGLFTSVLGTLVGAFFGLQIGASGTAAERERAQQAESNVKQLLGAITPEQAQSIRLE